MQARIEELSKQKAVFENDIDQLERSRSVLLVDYKNLQQMTQRLEQEKIAHVEKVFPSNFTFNKSVLMLFFYV